MFETEEGDYLLIGNSSNNTHLTKLDNNGNMLWDLDCFPVLRDGPKACKSHDGESLIVVSTHAFAERNLDFVKVNYNGEFIWDTHFDFTHTEGWLRPLDVVATTDNHYVGIFRIGFNLEDDIYYFVKFNDEGVVTSTTQYSHDFKVAVYPNPASEWVKFKTNIPLPQNATLQVVNVQGTTVFQQPLTIGNCEWLVDDNPAGLYFYTIQSNDEILYTRKLKIE